VAAEPVEDIVTYLLEARRTLANDMPADVGTGDHAILTPRAQSARLVDA